MHHYLCVTCGTQFGASPAPPLSCPVCEDERQYVNWKGQKWISPAELAETHSSTIRQLEPKLYGISTEPGFAIGQRALLVRSQEGNFLWDCLSLIDEASIRFIEELGGLQGIGLSHPHFYGAAVEWSHAFGGIPIYIHAADKKWVMREAQEIHFWEGPALELWDGLRIIHCGGHFAGSCILHYPQSAGGRGAIFTSDTLHVTMDRRYVSFMRSYPNLIPLSPQKVRQIEVIVQALDFDRIYGGWFDRNILNGAKEAFEKSVSRYLQAVEH